MFNPCRRYLIRVVELLGVLNLEQVLNQRLVQILDERCVGVVVLGFCPSDFDMVFF